MNSLGWAGIGWRFLAALVLVFATYNPSGYSYFHWLKNILPAINPYIVLVGILLIIGWAMYVRATTRALGWFGIVLIVAVCACVIWLFFEWGVLSFDSTAPLTWAILLTIVVALTAGMCWSHINRRLSGQADVDDVDEN
jgi:Family of unknown function (DUF6524)